MNLKKNLFPFLLTVVFSLFVSFLQAHPSWGIVATTSGEIIFADVMHGGEGIIWKIDKKGKLSKLFKNYHAHSLTLDQNDVLWAAANRYIEGVIEGDGEHVLTKIYPSGKTEELIRTRDITAFAGGTNTVTTEGEVVFTHKNQLFKVTKNGKVEPLIDHTFGRVVTMFTGKDGSIYITDNYHQNGSIFRISTNAKLEIFASELLEKKPANPPYRKPSHNLLYGMAEDAKGRIYVANSGSRRILQIGKSQETEIFYESEAPWFPVGLAFHNTAMYVMEVGFVSGKGHLGPRILKIEEDKAPVVIADTDKPNLEYSKGSLETPMHQTGNWRHHIFFFLGLILLGLIFWKAKRLFLLLPFSLFLGCNAPSSQAQEIPSLTMEDQKLIEEYTNLETPHSLQLTTPEEPGEPLLLIGQVVDRKTGEPLPNCNSFLYHTDAEGEYDQTDPNDQKTSRIKGELNTDDQGRFLIHTILPADYPGRTNNRHIHATFYHKSPYNMDIFFEPFATKGIKRWSKNSGHGVVVQLKKREEGYFAFAKITVPYNP